MRRRPLQWYGHVSRRDREEDIIMVAEMNMQRKRKREGAKEKVNGYSEGWHTEMWPLR